MNKVYTFEQLTDSVELLEKKPPRFINMFLGLLIAFLIGFCLWAYFGKIDIVSKGTAIIQGKKEASMVQSRLGGVVSHVAVQSGDYVKKGDNILQIKNQELVDEQNKLNSIVLHLESKKNMLIELKKSVSNNKPLFSNSNEHDKVRDEYSAYEQGYKLLDSEKELELNTIVENSVEDGLDDVLQSLIAEYENTQREMDSLNKKKNKEQISKEDTEVIIEQIDSALSQQNNLKKRIEQRKEYLEKERKKIKQVKEEKQTQKKQALKQYQQGFIVDINERIESIEQDILAKKQELDTITYQNDTMKINAHIDGTIQFSNILQEDNLIEPGQDIAFVIPKGSDKKVKLLLSPEEVKGINKGDKIQYSFQSNQQVGYVSYIPAHPIYDKDSKSYMYELEGTINFKKIQSLPSGVIGKASVVTGSEPIWKFLLRKLDFI
ncbi:HlyD family efflux transporter periplasmic adaptor subunit [Bacillus hominis]|uniref:HlyD family efflux transporter periplasmic adaptor subunit n=1 Tax=Bacillus hominis TaxID=2817478 RepID=A0ABT7RFX8_9BACI|nr:HlyD family efflux transporter periplasmic adaptor subunit [Bacillus hominis]MDM5191436.1 HlyD family efflux transporter periplasmic adaptor subunit [Bacillus hominis]MDM5441863.1 HlyD family efflux transporter periplasmic adaptor subunit [Bacillus hominis]